MSKKNGIFWTDSIFVTDVGSCCTDTSISQIQIKSSNATASVLVQIWKFNIDRRLLNTLFWILIYGNWINFSTKSTKIEDNVLWILFFKWTKKMRFAIILNRTADNEFYLTYDEKGKKTYHIHTAYTRNSTQYTTYVKCAVENAKRKYIYMYTTIA